MQGPDDTTDPNLIRIVHQEWHGLLRLSAMLTRSGGLTVFVDEVDGEGIHRACRWQGENILLARHWAAAYNANQEGASR